MVRLQSTWCVCWQFGLRQIPSFVMRWNDERPGRHKDLMQSIVSRTFRLFLSLFSRMMERKGMLAKSMPSASRSNGDCLPVVELISVVVGCDDVKKKDVFRLRVQTRDAKLHLWEHLSVNRNGLFYRFEILQFKVFWHGFKLNGMIKAMTNIKIKRCSLPLVGLRRWYNNIFE